MEKETIENLFEQSNDVKENVEMQPVEEINEENNTEVNPFVDLPPVTPVDYEQTEDTTVESIEQQNNEQSLNKEVLEHPDAKITLKNEGEEVISKKEIQELKDVKLSDNGSLKFVLILGIILLAIIFLIPYISEYIGM